MTDLAELLERVRAAEGPDRELDEVIHVWASGATAEWQEYASRTAYHKDGSWVSIGPTQPYTASIDAALALVERVYPGSSLYPDITPGNHSCGLRYGENYRDTSFGNGATPALAILAALLQALIAKGADK